MNEVWIVFLCDPVPTSSTALPAIGLDVLETWIDFASSLSGMSTTLCSVVPACGKEWPKNGCELLRAVGAPPTRKFWAVRESAGADEAAGAEAAGADAATTAAAALPCRDSRENHDQRAQHRQQDSRPRVSSFVGSVAPSLLGTSCSARQDALSCADPVSVGIAMLFRCFSVLQPRRGKEVRERPSGERAARPPPRV